METSLHHSNNLTSGGDLIAFLAEHAIKTVDASKFVELYSVFLWRGLINLLEFLKIGQTIFGNFSNRQNPGAVNTIESKTVGGQHQNENLIREVTCKMWWFSLYFVKYITLWNGKLCR